MSGRPRFHPLSVAEVERLTPDAVAIRFDVPDRLRAQYRFTPGQHVTVRSRALGDLRRTYSICSPAPDGELRIAVKQIPDGVVSGYLNQRLAAGDTLDVMTPTGTFWPRPLASPGRRYAAVAAGSGITPILSILTTALHTDPQCAVCLVFVNRSVADVMFLEELEDVKNRYPDRFQLIHVLDGEAGEVDLLHGRLDLGRWRAVLDRLVPPAGVDDWFLCGPRAMTEMIRTELLARGVAAAAVHRELFHAGPAPAASAPAASAPAASVPGSADPAVARAQGGTGSRVELHVVLAGRTQHLTMPHGGPSILEAVAAERPDVPFSCKNAVCGTCRATVVEGTVTMDANYALEPDEVAAGVVLTCQARPTSASVVIDYDR